MTGIFVIYAGNRRQPNSSNRSRHRRQARGSRQAAGLQAERGCRKISEIRGSPFSLRKEVARESH